MWFENKLHLTSQINLNCKLNLKNTYFDSGLPVEIIELCQSNNFFSVHFAVNQHHNHATAYNIMSTEWYSFITACCSVLTGHDSLSVCSPGQHLLLQYTVQLPWPGAVSPHMRCNHRLSTSTVKRTPWLDFETENKVWGSPSHNL